MISRPSLLPWFACGCLLFSVPGCAKKNNHDNPTVANCSAALSQECEQLKADIAKGQNDRDAAIAAKDIEKAVNLGLDVNYKIERLDLYRTGKKDSADHQTLDQRYARMRALLTAKETPTLLNQETPLACQAPRQEECSRLQSELRSLGQERETARLNHEAGRLLDLTLGINYRAELLALFGAGQGNTDEHRTLNRLYDTLAELIDRTVTAAGLPNGPASQTVCAQDQIAQCRQLEADLVRLRRDRDAALDHNDKQTASSLMLEINYKNELLEKYHQGFASDSEAVKQVISHYNALLNFFGSSAGLKPYTEREGNAVRQVFKDFGDLYIGETAQMQNATAGDKLPWSDFWYPSRFDTMYHDGDSPLGKFDRLSMVMGRPIDASGWERNRRDPNTAEWAGLCDAWAAASMLTKEPLRALTFHDIRFEITDLKALLTKSYEGYKPKFYGLRYTGSYETDGESQDLRPEAFHRIVEAVIGKQKAFIGLDDDPSPEVWNKPMFRMDWQVTKDTEHANAYLVMAFPKMIKNRDEINARPTTLQDMKAPKYEYRLYVDPTQARDGKYRVIYGEWIGTSLNDHPDMVFLPQPQDLNPTNREFAKNLDILNQLLSDGTPSP